MKRPAEVQLSPEDGEALRQRLEGDALTADDRRVLGQILQWYFWLVFALQEAKVSLKRLRALVFGESPTTRKASPADPLSDSAGDEGTQSALTEVDLPPARGDLRGEPAGARRPGHGRQGAEVYRGAEHVICRHETLAAGERCPVCGRGRLYRVEPGVDIRLDGHALLSAVRYVLEKLRCSACGQLFTAATPAEAGAEKYSARARAVLVLGRYYLGAPLYRLEGY
jgi:transposase